MECECKHGPVRGNYDGLVVLACVTRDTAPRLRCFDPAIDIALPPPAFLRGLRPVWKSSSVLCSIREHRVERGAPDI